MDQAGRILSRNWAHYDFEHVVFRPRNMTPEELREGRDFVLREFYESRRVLRRLAYAVRQFGTEVALSLAIPLNLAFSYEAHESPNPSTTARHTGEDSHHAP